MYDLMDQHEFMNELDHELERKYEEGIMENQLVVQNATQSLIDSVDLGVVQATMQKIATMQALIKNNLKQDHDFGIVAGAGSKPTLLKPGGEKICMIFGLNPEYDFLEKTENYKDKFFAYNIKCTLCRNGQPVSQGVGNCNSMEKKYAYINTDTLPEGIDISAVETITDRYGRKKYKIPNPHVADLVNTILKMAKKRAFIDAVLQVASLSDLFTQDLEDMKDFIQAEQTQAMDSSSAQNIKINFGKYKGMAIQDVVKTDKGYIEWLSKNGKDNVIRQACEMALNPVNEEVLEEEDGDVERPF